MHTRKRTKPTAENFFARVDQSGGPDACWPWTGPAGTGGYGKATMPRKGGRNAHRVAWYWTHGETDPTGLDIDHLCRNRICCNPAHLEAVTPQENNRRSTSPSAVNLTKTHCPRGHAYDETNTHITPQGQRRCRTCNRDRMRVMNRVYRERRAA